MTGPRIEIVEMSTGRVVKTIPLQHATDNQVERVMLGLLRNMDTDRYFAREILEEDDA